MIRRGKKIDPSELLAADDIDRTTIKGELRSLYPAIHQKLTHGGWSGRDMVAWLSQKGIPISLELFRVYLRDLDKENGYSRKEKASISATSESPKPAGTSPCQAIEIQPPGLPGIPLTAHKGEPSGNINKPPPGWTQQAWIEHLQREKSEARRNKKR